MADAWCAGQLLVGGAAAGDLVVLVEPVSFWGGVDDETGAICDVRHAQYRTRLAGTALLLGASRGSSSSASTFLECVRRDTAPALLLLTDPDPILVVGAAAAHELYGRGPSVVLLSEPPDATGVAAVRLDDTGHLFAEPVTTRIG